MAAGSFVGEIGERTLAHAKGTLIASFKVFAFDHDDWRWADEEKESGEEGQGRSDALGPKMLTLSGHVERTFLLSVSPCQKKKRFLFFAFNTTNPSIAQTLLDTVDALPGRPDS
jgi:hypothetical protein